MNNPSAVAVVLAIGLILLGLFTGGWQIRGMRQLAARRLVPSDELKYLRNRYRRRFITGLLLVAIGGMIGGAYLAGMAKEADRLGQPRDQLDDPANKPPMTDEEREFVRFWGVYWSVVLVLVIALVGFAMVDALATRRYWLAQYRALRDDHQTKLRRDLAVFKQHREQTRGGRGGNRLGEA